jgi:hypothetical protein
VQFAKFSVISYTLLQSRKVVSPAFTKTSTMAACKPRGPNILITGSVYVFFDVFYLCRYCRGVISLVHFAY